MKLRVIVGLLALTWTSGAVAAPPDAARLAKVDKIFDDWRLAAHVPGLVYGIVMDGKLVAVHGQGVQDITSAKPSRKTACSASPPCPRRSPRWPSSSCAMPAS